MLLSVHIFIILVSSWYIGHFMITKYLTPVAILLEHLFLSILFLLGFVLFSEYDTHLPSDLHDKKPAANFVKDPFHMVQFLLFSRFFFVFWQFFHTESIHGFLWVYPTSSLLKFLALKINGFHQIWKDLAIFSSNIFLPLSLPFFWDSHYEYFDVLDSVLHISEVLFIILHFFFPFCPVPQIG